jgi:hypothetical protein
LSTHPKAKHYEGVVEKASTRPHILAFDDGNSYVTKFRGNPEGDSVLIKEFVASELLRALDFARLDGRIVTVEADLMRTQAELAGLTPGPQFGSHYEPDNKPFSVKDLRSLTNYSDLPQVVVFDTFLCNTDRHLANIFFVRDRMQSAVAYRFAMIDHDRIFGRAKWDCQALGYGKTSRTFSDALNILDYISPTLDVFETFLLRLEALRPEKIESILDAVPSEWGFILSDKAAVLDFLLFRKGLVRSIITRDIAVRASQNTEKRN